jgi:hypothetical protein
LKKNFDDFFTIIAEFTNIILNYATKPAIIIPKVIASRYGFRGQDTFSLGKRSFFQNFATNPRIHVMMQNAIIMDN